MKDLRHCLDGQRKKNDTNNNDKIIFEQKILGLSQAHTWPRDLNFRVAISKIV